MAQTIQIKRGTRAELSTYGALQAGEMGFCTDTKEIYIGDGASNSFVGRALSGPEASRPGVAAAGRFYYVSSGTNSGYLYFDDGAAWRRVNSQKLTDLSGTVDDITDGVTYAKVLKADISAGHVNKVSDGTNVKTAAEIKTHIDDAAKHRVINDAGTAITDLWSAQKIRNEIELAKHNIEPQASVKDQNLSTPPASPAEGDRYIVAAGATGAWLGKSTQVAEYQSAIWVFYPPAVGWSAYVDDEQKVYSWNGSAWVRTGGALQTVNAGKGIQVDGNGVAANIDGSSIIYDAANGNRMMVAVIDGGTF
ncbi:DUF2793 domain-containing protein [Paenibacillus sp. NFR01]|uniref:DUF2793 domain-containing protein n=1 Tax=Paenibacillus sp. NFR01 TaxID=1566279 RepID=UPI0008CB5EE1|nr:DUF2793 domain-containing protein [Paenibacillus sp. NFR01]SEU26572.1 Protein of unknown function [Paenibacillus sp. NFR01]